MLICGFDCETTGLLDKDGTPGDQRIIEVCAQLWTLDGERKLNFVQRIDPQRSITAASQAVHGITSADLIGKPLWDDVAPKLHAVFRKAGLIVAHNAEGFDKPFVNGEFKRVGFPPVFPWFDTMLEGRWATPTGAVPSLEKLCWAVGVDYDPAAAHAASYDVSVMMEAFIKGVRWGWFRLPGASDVTAEAA
jgi:DNA polymerase-3 subunit epsilon